MIPRGELSSPVGIVCFVKAFWQRQGLHSIACNQASGKGRSMYQFHTVQINQNTLFDKGTVVSHYRSITLINCTMLSINKPLCTLKRTEYGTQSPVSGNPLTVLGLHVLLLFSSIQVATGQGTAMGSALVPPSTDCEQPVVVAVSTAQETACGNQDGKISIQVQDEEQDATYTVILTQEKKQVQYSSLSAPNGMVKISNLVPAGFTGIQIVREQDGCASAFFDEPFLIKPACLPANTRNTTCGGGVFPHQNCEGQTIYINGNNIAPQTFIYLDDDPWAA